MMCMCLMKNQLRLGVFGDSTALGRDELYDIWTCLLSEMGRNEMIGICLEFCGVLIGV
jgi:hypothetical protein